MKPIRTIVALFLLAFPGVALAQSSPGLIFGQVPTPAQWNSYFTAKQDVLGFIPLNRAGGTMTGPLITAPANSTLSGFNIQPGVSPSVPNNGDLWVTAAGLFVRVNGATVGPLSGATTSSFAGTSPIKVTFPSGIVTYAFDFTIANTFLAQQTAQGTTTTSPGWYAQIAGDTVPRVRVGLNATDVPSVAFGPGNANRDAFIERVGAGAFRFGAPDAASPVAQILGVQNVVAGTSNTAGTALTIAGSRGTGTGNGGNVLLQVAPAGSTGSAQNALITALSIFGADAGLAVGNPTGGDKGAFTLNSQGLMYVAGNAVAISASSPIVLNATTGALTCPTCLIANQSITLSGDATGSGTTAITVTNVNLPTGVTVAGSLLHSNIAAPGTPASGKDIVWTDSTDLRFHDKNASGIIGTTVVAAAAVSNQFVTAISAAGAVSQAQPSFSNISGTIATGQVSGSYTGITGVGTLTAGATGAGFTVALTTSTITGNLPVTNSPSTGTNTVLGNATSGSATMTALSVSSCSAASSALIWTTNSGFGCNTSITANAVPAANLTGATLAAGVTASSLTSFGASPTLSTPVINGLPTGTGVATANTASTLVSRDGSGNFSAGTITASLTGHASLDLALTGGTMSGAIAMGGNAITGGGNFTASAFIPSSSTLPTNGMYLPAANTVGFAVNSLQGLQIRPIASAVDYAYITGAATGGNRVTYGADGSDTDISIDFIAKGAGSINFNGQGSNAGGIMRAVSFGSGAANGLLMTSAGTGSGPSISAFDLGGTGNANIAINIIPKGTGSTILSTTLTIQGIASDTAQTDSTMCITSAGLTLKGTGTLGICLGTSSARYKTGIEDLNAGLTEIMAMKPKSFYLDAEHGIPDKKMYGFLAEDCAKTLPTLTGFDNKNRPNTCDYLGVVPVLVNAVKELKADNDNMREQLRKIAR